MTTFDPRDPGRIATLAVLTRASSGLSIIASLAMLFDIVRRWRSLTASPARIVLWWTLADLIYLPWTMVSTGLLHGVKAKQPAALRACTAQGWAIQFGFMASAVCSAVMATNIFLTVCRRVPLSGIKHYERYHHIAVWVVPAILATFPLFLSVSPAGIRSPFYADAIVWCGIAKDWAPYRFYIFYLPIAFVFAYNMVIYVTVFLKIRRVFGGLENSMEASDREWSRKQFRARVRFAVKAGLYVSSFFFTYTPGIISRTMLLFHKDPVWELSAIHAFFEPLGAFVNAAIYFSSYLMRERPVNSVGESLSSDETMPTRGGAGSTSGRPRNAGTMFPLVPAAGSASKSANGSAHESSIPLRTWTSSTLSSPAPERQSSLPPPSIERAYSGKTPPRPARTF